LAEKLITEGKAYYCFCTPEELEAARENALAQGLTPKYNRKCLNLSRKEIEEKLNSNVSKVIRLKMPDNTTFE
jgi:glutamyl/glutaminyl-tRNA synthetase